MKKLLFLVVVILAVSTAMAGQLEEELLKIKGVISVEELDRGTFAERYVVMIEQPLDHKNPKKGSFEQRIVVAHSGHDRPTLLVTEGYGGARALLPGYREEISKKLNTNQVFVEHRFFGESTPKPRDWSYLTGENAAADLHRVRRALSEIYSRKWIASGISKGGQNTMIYAAYYPGDVDCYVPYVAPVCTGIEDGRHEPFLSQVGTPMERAAILEFQKELLRRRADLVPMLEEYCRGKSYTFNIPIDEVFDYMVLEYSFSVWQWGLAVSTIPGTDAPHEELIDNLITIVSPDYLAVSDEPSFFVQAARELGYYGYDIKPFEGLLRIKDAKDYLRRIFLPKDAHKIRFTPALSEKIISYLRANDPRMIFIYGEIDPWSAVMPSLDLFEGKHNMELVVAKQGSHKTRIESMPEEVRDRVWARIASWLK